MGIRLTGLGGFASSTVQAAALNFRLLALELATCPRGVAGLGASWSPCAAAQFGALWAEYGSAHGTSDSGPWASAALYVRAVWRSKSLSSLEAQLGAQLPLVRYEMQGNGEGDDPLARTAPIGLVAAIGAAFSLL